MEATEYLTRTNGNAAAAEPAPGARALAHAEQSEAEIVAAAYASDVARLERMMKKQADDNAARMASLERMIEGMARAVALGSQHAPAPVHQAPAAVAGGSMLPASLPELLSLVKALRDVAAPPPQTTMQDTLQMMMSVMDFREKIASSVQPAGDGSAFGAMLPALIGPLATALERASAQPAPAPAPAPAAPALPPGRPAAAAPVTTQTLGESEMSKTGPIHDLLTALPLWAKLAITQQAAANVDPETLVDHVLSIVPDDALDKLAEAFESVDDATEEIVMRIPKWLPYKAWLRKLVAAIAARLLEELQDTTETAAPGARADGDTAASRLADEQQ